MAIERVIDNGCRKLSVDQLAGRLINQCKPGFVNFMGDTVKDNRVNELMDQLTKSTDYKSIVQQVQSFNDTNQWTKKGIAVQDRVRSCWPLISPGISFDALGSNTKAY